MKKNLFCKNEIELLVSWVCDWTETTAITYLSILIYNGTSYDSITGWHFMGKITGKGGLNQLFRLKWKVQRSNIAACSELGKLGQFHNILEGSKLGSCCTEGELGKRDAFHVWGWWKSTARLEKSFRLDMCPVTDIPCGSFGLLLVFCRHEWYLAEKQ